MIVAREMWAAAPVNVRLNIRSMQSAAAVAVDGADLAAAGWLHGCGGCGCCCCCYGDQVPAR